MYARSLVIAQYLILGYFILFHPIRQDFGPQDVIAWTLVIAGIALGASALLAMRRSRFRISPEPHAEAALITSGPYVFIRHPMYAALLILTFGLFLNYPVIEHLIAFLLLFIILSLKINYEERLLVGKFPSYASYQSHTKRFFPFVY